MPITNLPVVIPRSTTNVDLRNGHPAAQSAWASAIDKVNRKRADLKRRAAATIDWVSVVEKLSTALKQQAGAARAAALARALEKLRSQQMALGERAAPLTTADLQFDRIWYGQCADEVGPKSVASGT
jgi:DNA-binding helix-hairpin-helix protein with protein kinase domain